MTCRSPQAVGIHWFFLVYWLTVLVCAQILQKVRLGLMGWLEHLSGDPEDDIEIIETCLAAADPNDINDHVCKHIGYMWLKIDVS